MSLTPEQRTLRARIAAHASWANTTDRTSRTEKARQARDAKYLEKARQLHPDVTDEDALKKIANHLMVADSVRRQYRKSRKNPASE